MQYLGDFSEDATVYIPFNTFSSDDPQASVTITNLVDADLKVHKDGGLTQIVTDGATITIDFDSITGNHLATIDTSAHADYAVGSDYMVRMEGTTVDGGTINAWIGSFSIENRFNDVNVVTVSGTAQTANDNGADINAILVDTNELQGDWVNGGRLDLILDARMAEASISTTGGAVDSVTLVATTTNNTDMRGTDLAGTAAELAKVPKSDGTASWNATALAAINAEADTALTDYDAATGTELAAVDTKIDTIDTNVDAVLVDTGTTLPATLSTIDTVVDAILALLDDPRAEPGQGAPAVNADAMTKLDYLYKFMRNKVEQTATTYSVYDDAGTTVDHKATVSDDGTTATRGEIATGP